MKIVLVCLASAMLVFALISCTTVPNHHFSSSIGNTGRVENQLPAPLPSAAIGTGQWLDEQWHGYERAVNKQDASQSDFVNDITAEGFFMGYVMGVIDVNVHKINVPRGEALTKIAVFIGNYLDSHRNQWGLPAAVIVVEALHAAFPQRNSSWEYTMSGEELNQLWPDARQANGGGFPNAIDRAELATHYYYANLYLGYVEGVTFSSVPKLYLIAPRVTMIQVETIVGNYVDSHPAQWNEIAAAIVLDAVSQAFPNIKEHAQSSGTGSF